jgi:hypothetical protein
VPRCVRSWSTAQTPSIGRRASCQGSQEIPKVVNPGKLPKKAASKFKSAPNETGRKPAWLLALRQNRTAFTGHYWVRVQIRRAFGSRKVWRFAPQRNWRLTPITCSVLNQYRDVGCSLREKGYWGQSPNSPNRWFDLQMRRQAPLRNWCLTPITFALSSTDCRSPRRGLLWPLPQPAKMAHV